MSGVTVKENYDISDMEVDLETAAVMKQRVAETTRDGYECRNIKFMIWLFNNHQKYPNLLESNLYHALLDNDRIDKTELTRGGRPSKARRYVRKKCREALRNINLALKNQFQ